MYYQLLKKLFQLHFFSPKTLWYLGQALRKTGINLSALLQWQAKMSPKKIAINEEQRTMTYAEWWQSTMQVAYYLQHHHGLSPQKKVALIGKNHADLLIVLFASARLGVDIYLLSTELSAQQYEDLQQKHQFDVLIYEPFLAEKLTSLLVDNQGIILFSEISEKAKYSIDFPALPAIQGGKLVVLTSGTTGNFKTAARKPHLGTFLSPFFELILSLDLQLHQSFYLAPPIYHGFGLAAVFMGIALGAKMQLLPTFEAETSLELLQKNQIEIALIVPLMLHRWLEKNPELPHLQSIISGGAPLAPTLIEKLSQQLPAKLYNLYGTSEAGFCMMAKSKDLIQKKTTIGKAILGVQAKLEIPLEHNESKIGQLYIRSKWTIQKEAWVATGDLAYQDAEGFYYLVGRTDDMIVSGGENVYPQEVENVLLNHEAVADAAVIGVNDAAFGQRLQAFLVLKEGSQITEKELLTWLSQKLARYQMPRQIVFMTALPYNALGKLERQKLQSG
ncbi:MAG: class I adenylate-forming enzyme family protein [Bacteroidia bacterium]